MVSVDACDGSRRFIPSDRADLQINSDWLRQKGACSPGFNWFTKTFPNGSTYLELRSALALDKKEDWERWIANVVGGDTATAGTRGTATAGYAGTATAGSRGTATAGDAGTATAGDEGTATAGDEGVIRIREWNEKLGKYRVITGIIGENGILPNTPYIVVDSKLVIKKP